MRPAADWFVLEPSAETLLLHVSCITGGTSQSNRVGAKEGAESGCDC